MPEESRYRSKARKYRGRWLKAKSDIEERDGLLEELATENEQLKTDKETATGELGKLKSTAKARAHREEFDRQAKKANVNSDYLDDLWKLAEVDTEADEPDGKELAKTIKENVKKRPYMIKAKPDDNEESEEETDEDGDLGDDEEDSEEPAPKSKLKAESKPMQKGEGHARGGRTNLKPPSIDEIIDEDYKATGRDLDHPFRI